MKKDLRPLRTLSSWGIVHMLQHYRWRGHSTLMRWRRAPWRHSILEHPPASGRGSAALCRAHMAAVSREESSHGGRELTSSRGAALALDSNSTPWEPRELCVPSPSCWDLCFVCPTPQEGESCPKRSGPHGQGCLSRDL